MGAPAKQDWREARRRRAWELNQQGWKQRTIAQALGVSEGAVSQWLTRGREQGEEALAAHPPPGVPARWTPEQLQRLPSLLEQGAEHDGFGGQVWTSRRVAAVIAQEYGVRYHPDHVRKLLRALGWSPQQPAVQASQQNDEAVQEWVEQRWPVVKTTLTP
jgi:transposase